MQALTLAASATIQMGTAGGSGAVLNFANSSAKTWSGTLSIANWNGAVYGGGADQIKFGSHGWPDDGPTGAGQVDRSEWRCGCHWGHASWPAVKSCPTLLRPRKSRRRRIVNGEFVFNVVPGVPGQTSVIQLATNLTPPVYWENVLTNTGAFSFTNSIAYPEVFFRVLVP